VAADGSAPQRRGRGATFAGFTEKIREKISAAPPAPLNLGDPNVRSELAKEYQPPTVELEKGEWFDDVKHDGKAIQLKMTKAGITIVEPLTKVCNKKKKKKKKKKKIRPFTKSFFLFCRLQAICSNGST
jgi:hypothetical protein